MQIIDLENWGWRIVLSSVTFYFPLSLALSLAHTLSLYLSVFVSKIYTQISVALARLCILLVSDMSVTCAGVHYTVYVIIIRRHLPSLQIIIYIDCVYATFVNSTHNFCRWGPNRGREATSRTASTKSLQWKIVELENCLLICVCNKNICLTNIFSYCKQMEGAKHSWLKAVQSTAFKWEIQTENCRFLHVYNGVNESKLYHRIKHHHFCIG